MDGCAIVDVVSMILSSDCEALCGGFCASPSGNVYFRHHKNISQSWTVLCGATTLYVWLILCCLSPVMFSHRSMLRSDVCHFPTLMWDKIRDGCWLAWQEYLTFFSTDTSVDFSEWFWVCSRSLSAVAFSCDIRIDSSVQSVTRVSDSLPFCDGHFWFWVCSRSPSAITSFYADRFQNLLFIWCQVFASASLSEAPRLFDRGENHVLFVRTCWENEANSAEDANNQNFLR